MAFMSQGAAARRLSRVDETPQDRLAALLQASRGARAPIKMQLPDSEMPTPFEVEWRQGYEARLRDLFDANQRLHRLLGFEDEIPFELLQPARLEFTRLLMLRPEITLDRLAAYGDLTIEYECELPIRSERMHAPHGLWVRDRVNPTTHLLGMSTVKLESARILCCGMEEEIFAELLIQLVKPDSPPIIDAIPCPGSVCKDFRTPYLVHQGKTIVVKSMPATHCLTQRPPRAIVPATTGDMPKHGR